ncbi:hypothetical protein [Ruminococcus flavefaciens]|uniref:hypothetical protein n=1 Tax=Ruminococcus flavefaciens TaxID=1265 RepID=UPI0026ECD014|nr:hypothetical protein [Ruminococcus flavefaciens]MDD7517867.1 hypothetical protein [Ruminococcus flavefaciens]MDY5691854.1 hypothetical protein [Ruminococcus flavefaciens]
MMKRLFSIISAVVICLCLLPMTVIHASAASNDYAGWDGNWQNSTLIDTEYNGGEGLFSEENKAALIEKIQDCSKKLEMNILVYVGGVYRYDEVTKSFCDTQYDQTYGNDTDGVFYYIDLSGKSPAYDYISTAGKAILCYENYKENIFESLDYYLPSSGSTIYESDIYNAVDAFLNQLVKYAETSHSAFNYYHDKNTGRYVYYKDGKLMITDKKPPALWLMIALICSAIGALVGLITYFIAKNSYKFKSKTNPSIYLSPNDAHLSQNSDTFIRSYVTKHRIESNSGGGSRGGGGGHHSGGGSHGGGGHHR